MLSRKRLLCGRCKRDSFDDDGEKDVVIYLVGWKKVNVPVKLTKNT
jgi:hypothetical protein